MFFDEELIKYYSVSEDKHSVISWKKELQFFVTGQFWDEMCVVLAVIID